MLFTRDDGSLSALLFAILPFDYQRSLNAKQKSRDFWEVMLS
ncbi:hypothetical protein spyM18_0831 [Streptococcus pyogenes MGAS8232]|nr:hypothetical protein spyM18_0831 [Streptococcus pyogenes MGAS8232]